MLKKILDLICLTLIFNNFNTDSNEGISLKFIVIEKALIKLAL